MRVRGAFRIAARCIAFLISHAAWATEICDQPAAYQDWLYLIDPSGITLAEMAASGFDGVVTDYSRDGTETGEWTTAEVSALHAAGMVSLAYMSIGEAEEYRFYWRPEWTYTPPAWLGPENRAWAGNYKVRYWDPDWQAIIYGTAAGADTSYLDRIIDQGFDGVYLDIVDAYSYWSAENPELTRGEARSRMIDLVAAIAHYARVARGRSAFLVFPQNAEEIVFDDNGSIDAEGDRYLALCDGIGAEDVWYDRLAPQPPGETAYRLALLDAFRTRNGTRAVLSVDYVWDTSDPGGAGNRERYNTYHRKARGRGFLAYAASSDRVLDTIVFRARGDGFDYAQPEANADGRAAMDLNGPAFSPGDRFTATFRLVRTIARPFTAYAAVLLPDASMRDARTLGAALNPVAEKIPGLSVPFETIVLDIAVPEGTPAGDCEIVAAFFDPAEPVTKRGDAFMEAAAGFTIAE